MREAERQHLHFPSEGVDVYVLVPGVENDNLYAAIAVYEPDSEVEESRPFEGFVLVSVLEGSLVLDARRTRSPSRSASGIRPTSTRAASSHVRTGPGRGRALHLHRGAAAVPPDPFAVGGRMGAAVP